MNREIVDRLARALLYEGYILYPYRPSVKNKQRWTFGGIYPKSWSDAQNGSDAWTMQTQCLASTAGDTAVQVAVRFLHLMDRIVGELTKPLTVLPTGDTPEYRIVESLSVDERQFQPWQEAVEREVDLGEFNLRQLASAPQRKVFAFPHHRAIEHLRTSGGEVVGLLVREQHAISGEVEIAADAITPTLYRLTVRILNRTEPMNASKCSRDEALLHSFISMHTVLGVSDGEFVSLIDPPEEFKDAAAACKNIGTWPILVGTVPARATMLSSPITLYDYPELAPESPGDLFDSTEIDEILTLRILTLTDEEKRATAVDDRARDLLARTEALARDQLMNLHGTMRGLRRIPPPSPGTPGEGRGEGGLNLVGQTFLSVSPTTDKNVCPTPDLEDPFLTLEEQEQRPRLDYVTTSDGIDLRPGDRVILHPLGRADIFDIALDGKTATILSIEQDYENRVHLAVSIDDDPGRDLAIGGKPGHRFFYGIEEVEPLAKATAGSVNENL